MRPGSTTAPSAPWNVIRELATMQERMNRIWGVPHGRDHEEANPGAWAPVVDIYENGGRELVIKADVPGLKREDIDLTFDSNVLTVRGSRRPDEGVKDESYHRLERAYGPFSRLLYAPGHDRRRACTRRVQRRGAHGDAADAGREPAPADPGGRW